MPQQFLVITIGFNPLPCVVEAHRICRYLQAKGEDLPRILAFHSRDNRRDAARVRTLLESKLGTKLAWELCELADAYSPQGIFNDAVSCLRSHIPVSPARPQVHLAYTGGTKAMSLHVSEALSDRKDLDVFSSYLRRDNHCIYVRGQDYQSNDERRALNLTMSELVGLHGYDASSSDVSLDVVEVGMDMLRLMMAGEHHQYYRWLSKWKKLFSGGKDRDVNLSRLRDWPDTSIRWHCGSDPDWQAMSARLATLPTFGGPEVWTAEPGGGWSIRIRKSLRRYLEPLGRFFDNQPLELYAYRSLRSVLAPEYEVRHSVRCVDRHSGREHELDVIGILGYQLFVVSCTLSSNPAACKRKAFEVIHRARQAGGDNARPALLCLLSPEYAKTLQDELSEYEMPIRIFHGKQLDDAGRNSLLLPAAFDQFFQRELRWSKENS